MSRLLGMTGGGLASYAASLHAAQAKLSAQLAELATRLCQMTEDELAEHDERVSRVMKVRGQS